MFVLSLCILTQFANVSPIGYYHFVESTGSILQMVHEKDVSPGVRATINAGYAELIVH